MQKITMDDIEKIFRHRRTTTVGDHNFFAVLVPLVKHQEGWALLYEVRGKNLQRQPGEICFPGGAMEEGETPLQCATREACEELGVEREAIRVISKLDTLHTVSNFTIYCYLGELDTTHMEINTHEVESTFAVPLEFLIENPPEMHYMDMMPRVDDGFPYEKIDFQEGYRFRQGKADIPIYQFEDKVIWGITARITDNFIQVLEGKKR
ncbi:MAG: NUDIX hydrolase [Anaerovoracaceae bacterium]|jgi:coenzyme A diphosphatase NUDT7